MTTQEIQKGKILKGIVVSDKMKDTIVVLVTRYVKHKRLKKFCKKRKKFLVHDSGNSSTVGQEVSIIECSPISKKKHFKIIV